jgi:hypothetical protein
MQCYSMGRTAPSWASAATLEMRRLPLLSEAASDAPACGSALLPLLLLPLSGRSQRSYVRDLHLLVGIRLRKGTLFFRGNCVKGPVLEANVEI